MKLIAYTIFLIFTTLIFLVGCKNENESSRNSFLSTELNCEPPAVVEVEAWGQSGVAQSCKIRDGEFIAWEHGYINIRGAYKNGVKSGKWGFYDKNGKLVKTIDYSNNQ